MPLPCADPESFFRGGSTWTTFFIVEFINGREDPSTTVSGLSSARQRNAISMAFRGRADGGPTLNAGLEALWFYGEFGPVLLRNPIFFVIFRVCVWGGGSGSHVSPRPVSPHGS